MEALIRRTMPRSLAAARPALYLAIVLSVLAATYIVKLRTTGIFACPAAYGDVAYLSDCNAGNYGDYDHGAIWFGLEPEAQMAASKARVLFLGNSRLQFAMSSPATARWFDERSIPFYSLGFSHYESVTFVTPVLERVKPQARAYVINADRFFAEWESPTSRRVMHERDAHARYDEKRAWQRLHKPLCSTLPALCGNELAVYRTVGNGVWFTSGVKPDERVAVADGPPADAERWPEFVELANRFLGHLPVDRQCVVLTIVPYARTKRAEAQAIAKALGVPFIAPSVDGLTTFDGSHLDSRSASRWAAAFLDAAGPVIERCAGGGFPATASRGTN
jgi:hypothetical protein